MLCNIFSSRLTSAHQSSTSAHKSRLKLSYYCAVELSRVGVAVGEGTTEDALVRLVRQTDSEASVKGWTSFNSTVFMIKNSWAVFIVKVSNMRIKT